MEIFPQWSFTYKCMIFLFIIDKVILLKLEKSRLWKEMSLHVFYNK